MSKEFDTWWEREGSSLKPAAGEDTEEHTKRVAAIAWSNGTYTSALVDSLYTALPFVEDASEDDCYDRARVQKVLAEIKATIAKATGVQP